MIVILLDGFARLFVLGADENTGILTQCCFEWNAKDHEPWVVLSASTRSQSHQLLICELKRSFARISTFECGSCLTMYYTSFGRYRLCFHAAGTTIWIRASARARGRRWSTTFLLRRMRSLVRSGLRSQSCCPAGMSPLRFLCLWKACTLKGFRF